MPKAEIDFEKDYLVITRNREGTFRSFRWYPSVVSLPKEVGGDSEITASEMEEKILKWNEGQKKPENDGLCMELVTDKLAMEICAYREKAEPFEDIIKDARDIQESIDEAMECLESALSDLKGIRGLD